MGSNGKLFLIPNLIGETPPLEVIPFSVKKHLERLVYYIFEREKAGRAFIKKISPNVDQGSLKISTLNKFTLEEDIDSMIAPCFEGYDVGLITDAGCPGVADPGAAVVSLAHLKDIQVVPLVGPSSILLALMASGLNGQSFAFNGYLPIKQKERKQAIKYFEKHSAQQQQTQLFIETPYRNMSLLQDFKEVLGPSTFLSIACDISSPTEVIKTFTVEEWKSKTISLQNRPTIFSFFKPNA